MKQTGNTRLLTFWCLLIVLVGWGLSWEVLRYQTGSPGLPAPTIPVFYRFLFAGFLFTTYVLVRDRMQGRNTLRFSLSTWGLIALLGLGFFSLNYSLFYAGQRGLPPGLVALFFSFVAVTNLGVTTLFTRRLPRASTTLAALVGFAGLVVVLWPSIWAGGTLEMDLFTLQQAGLCLAGTLVVSFATMVQVRLNTLGVPVMSSTAVAMLFGASYVGLYSLMQGVSFDIRGLPFSFYGGLAFLALFASIGAFYAYLRLVGLIGANRGAYVNLATAALALVISYFLGTGDSLTWGQGGGIVLIMLGSYLILRDQNAARV